MIKSLNELTLYTNNPMVRDKFQDKLDVCYSDSSFFGLLSEVKRGISSGKTLLSHPLSGSVKPGETPFKSLLLSRETSDMPELLSINLIDEALEKTKVFFIDNNIDLEAKPSDTPLPQSVINDLELIDYTLIYSALQSVPDFGTFIVD